MDWMVSKRWMLGMEMDEEGSHVEGDIACSEDVA